MTYDQAQKGMRVRVRRAIKSVGLLAGHEGKITALLGRERVLVLFPGRRAYVLVNVAALELVRENPIDGSAAGEDSSDS